MFKQILLICVCLSAFSLTSNEQSTIKALISRIKSLPKNSKISISPAEIAALEGAGGKYKSLLNLLKTKDGKTISVPGSVMLLPWLSSNSKMAKADGVYN